MEIDLTLHPGQIEVIESPKRFKVCAAGRRWGKTRYGCVELITKALQDETQVNGRKVELRDFECWYVAPTYDQARSIVWGLLKNLCGDLVKKTWENEGRIQLINGRMIQIKGSDKPDRLRGSGLYHVLLDEYASMKPRTWVEIIQPALTDVEGTATFIGSPMGKNHFYDIWKDAQSLPDWDAFHFKTQDNPYLPAAEVQAAKERMPREIFMQEYEASFEQSNQLVFPYDVIECREEDVPDDAANYMAIDLAGFLTEGQARTANTRLDQAAIAIVAVSREGWWVRDVVAGRWDVRETSLRILRECQKHKPLAVGIEQGIARNAILPYLNDQMRRLGIWPNLIEVKHGGKDKASRIAWALQGRMEHGRIQFVRGPYLADIKEQIWDFPFGRHDDMVDALAYIDQIAQVTYQEDFIVDTWQPMDEAVGL